MRILKMPAKWGKKTIITTDDGFGVIALDIENEQPHVGFIHDLVVDESKRKQGIGTQLIDAVIDCAKDMGCGTVVLWCEPILWLHQWYKRKGFIETEIGEYGYARMIRKL